ncbi:DUF2911 domain-containing protein [Paraflavisolibacter sp. H34]|uniref:DUF2911 domain-containing protein n=1 Tax=Huijunlia imazamoxiresistens TaxID=3127457 RepID=UPI00301A130B
MFKKIVLCSALVALFATADAQSIKMPQPSPSQTVTQNFGLGTIELSYSRPGVKGRKVFGDLVPYGQVWRTGANQATTLTFSDEVTIGGKKIPAGKYGLLSIPDANSWTLIITKQLDVTSPAAYKPENDVVRVQAKPQALPFPVETFTILFSNVKPAGTDLQLIWDNVAVSLPISTDIDSKVMTQIDNALNKDTRPYFQAAAYYLETGKDLNQALKWFDKALEQQPNAFFIHYQKAQALAKLGRKDEARKTAEKSMELARQQKNTDYVRLNEKLIATLK